MASDEHAIESRIPGFHRLTRGERLATVADAADLDPVQVQDFAAAGAAHAELMDHMAENVIGAMTIPLGVATNLVVDGVPALVPMATEESSVVAAVCNGARRCLPAGGVFTSSDDPCMIAQVQITGLRDPIGARARVMEHAAEIRAICDGCDPMLVSLGGGFRSIEARIVAPGSLAPPMLVVHLIVDVRDAMGANAVNTMAEAVAPKIAAWTGGKAGLRILSNLADRRLVRARATFPLALEAGAHAFAARSGRYTALSRWEATHDGDLSGVIELPMPVGVVGGATKAHPTAKLALQIMGVTGADRLGRVMAAVGLVQNFSAMLALATEGIQRGHMALHAKNLAVAAGAAGAMVEKIAAQMIAEKAIRGDRAAQLVAAHKPR